MEIRPPVGTRIHHLVSHSNLVCVVTLLALCWVPVSSLSTTPTTDQSLTPSLQPSFSSSHQPDSLVSSHHISATSSQASSVDSSLSSFGVALQPSSLDNTQPGITSLQSDVLSVLPSSREHSSELLATQSVVNLSHSTVSATRLSHQDSGHVTLNSPTQLETFTSLPSSVLLEPTYTPSQPTVVASTPVSSASYSPEGGGMNSSTSTESSGRTTVFSNETQSSVITTSTVSPPFGNASCLGNNTGCPEYNGKDDVPLSTPAIIGIAVGAAVFVIIVVCLVVCQCRRRRTLSGSKADLSTYWDDNVTLSYINGHLDYPKDVSDEMVSLDNDSFLNSLDSMSFSNMWATETAKHTNF